MTRKRQMLQLQALTGSFSAARKIKINKNWFDLIWLYDNNWDQVASQFYIILITFAAGDEPVMAQNVLPFIHVNTLALFYQFFNFYSVVFCSSVLQTFSEENMTGTLEYCRNVSRGIFNISRISRKKFWNANGWNALQSTSVNFESSNFRSWP